MALTKQYLKTRPVCKVTFRLPKKAAPQAKRVHLVGDFNDWNTQTMPMQRLKSGEFKLVVDLSTGRDYAFRYLIDQKIWENDWEADRYIPSPYEGVNNSIVSLPSK